ncbi:helix-turn-helix domain-containing protein [Natronolimnohabitans sp. A-GB9]|uniref:helix-turn-helix domain-containing protein n=1 Tax=Natronolimnohabitans sp. A-GB9 TaxID=3069757 RepID=UPI0027B5B356|nr:helix-turn-helix domain-containing protein [Natronolimnohabitans sp. A-GB9]MDQ2049066.1 helix-turn-helix domain-containing protein [Natronolimnohabitans sp. A-GB9]
MSFIAEYTLSNPILEETRRAVPTVTVEVEDEQPAQGEQSQLIFWASGEEDALERFFRELPNDPSITSFELLSILDERRLFRVTLTDSGERGLTYTDAIALDITFLDIEARGIGMQYRAQVPNRDVLFEYRKRCEERDLSFELRRLYRSEAATTEKYDLTPRQRDVLRRALAEGYFEVPREISTAELAEEFDISSQAISALLRRGQKAILQSTLDDGDSI